MAERAERKVPLDDLLGQTVEQDGHEWTVAYRPESKKIAFTRLIDLDTLLEMLRSGALRPDTTSEEVRRAPLPATRDETRVEIAHVEAILQGSFAARLDAKLVVAYQEQLQVLRKHLEQMPEGLSG